ncbi:MAG: caspase family protein [Candidatus Rokubacteria bacterium]|nr:caspase family protein [Candidatus Rokubacteria bacterium]
MFIYYAGHGALEADLANREPDGQAKYLVPYDADAKDLFASAINMTEVETFFSRIRAETVVLVLDTCYSGAGSGRGFVNLPAGGRDVAVKGDFLDRLAQGKGRAILTAADANEVALEVPELKHGLFTYHFLEGLRGRADAQGKGYVSLQDARATRLIAKPPARF